MVIKYLEYDTILSVAVSNADVMKFPDVVICEANPVNFTRELELGLRSPVSGRKTAAAKAIQMYSTHWDFERLARFLNNPITSNKLAIIQDDLVDLMTRMNTSFMDLVYSLTMDLPAVLQFCYRGEIDEYGMTIWADCAKISR